MNVPELLIVGGANGSGKTTFARECVAQFGMRYLGADDIAAELSPSQPARARIPAACLFSERLTSTIGKRESLIVESRLAGASLKHFLLDAKAGGFNIKIFYIFVDSPELCLARISARVARGGHGVPEADVRRRFGRSLRNFWNLYRLLSDSWSLFYNSSVALQQIAVGDNQAILIHDSPVFKNWQQLIAEYET